MKPNKKKFEVEASETLAGCLARMKQEGYTPVRRMEQPVFTEKDGEKTVDHQKTVFEGKLIEE
ncbi:NETI motif-containing protein [Salinicoccus albus]|uniref:NETI motif-containing protein n=1 Tax=Salinicoccus albus TaxID=418756 RepID=UPI00036435E4|nr:NETI motif-containing protein [Salinicoccus albus]